MIRKDIYEFRENPFRLFDKNWAILCAKNKEITNSMTISWGSLGTLYNKPVVIVYVRKTRFTHKLMEEAPNFTISFLDPKYRKDMSILGTLSGRDSNKIENTNLHYAYDIDSDTAYIKEADIVFKMKKISKLSLDDDTILDKNIIKDHYESKDEYHDVYIGFVTSYLEKETNND